MTKLLFVPSMLCLDATDPLSLLMACHTRVRSLTATAIQLARVEDAAGDDLRDTATRVRRFFGIALPLHEEDEEQSLTPLLLESRARADAEGALDAMAEQHVAIDSLVGALKPAWTALSKGLPSGLEPGALLDRTLALDGLITAHIGMEEQIIFPHIKVALTPAAREHLQAEMRGRRTPERLAAVS